jgi:hypothetical protein
MTVEVIVSVNVLVEAGSVMVFQKIMGCSGVCATLGVITILSIDLS